MPLITNPAVAAFMAQLGSEFIFAQVLIRHQEHGYELRHVDDCHRDSSSLRIIPLDEVRRMVQFTAAGVFRPLKSAPNLQSNWRIIIHSPTELEATVNQLNPGAIADWYAAQSATPPVTDFREFINRQTGMYQITQKLTDTQAVEVIKTGCHRTLCLKRRLWTVTGLESDSKSEKSAIPCLEPCAMLLEYARKAMRLEKPRH